MKTSLGVETHVYPTPVFIVGTYDAEGRPNAMTVAWGGICCSKPPCVNISVRKTRYTYCSLMQRKAFTINIPSRDQVAVADYLGIVSGRDADKLAAAGLTPIPSDVVDAPYLAEFPLGLGCTVVHIADLGAHTMFVGEILEAKSDQAALTAEGKLSAKLVQPLCFVPGDGLYFALGKELGAAFSVGKALDSTKD